MEGLQTLLKKIFQNDEIKYETIFYDINSERSVYKIMLNDEIFILRIKDTNHINNIHNNLDLQSHINYAKAVEYIKNNKIDIPIPNVYKYDKIDKYEYIILEFIEGDLVPDDDDAIIDENIINQLKEIRKKLKNIKSNKIKSFGPKLNHPRLINWNYEYELYLGPSNNIKEYLINRLNIYKNDEFKNISNEIKDLINALNTNKFILEKCDIVLCHGDFSGSNIITKNNKIISIIDWEYAGFYPEYHEDFYTFKNEPLHYIIYTDSFKKKYPNIMKIEEIINYINCNKIKDAKKEINSILKINNNC